MYKLYTNKGDFVAEVETDSPYQKPPEILLFGSRVFMYGESKDKKLKYSLDYFEAFMVSCQLKKEPVDESHVGQPIDSKTRVTNSGRDAELPDDSSAPAEINTDTGQHKDYWVLSESERSKGFVRPVRDTYVHDKCGVATTMGRKIAETYARNPKFYGSTFCVGSKCQSHFPVSEFKWDDGSVVGS